MWRVETPKALETVLEDSTTRMLDGGKFVAGGRIRVISVELRQRCEFPGTDAQHNAISCVCVGRTEMICLELPILSSTSGKPTSDTLAINVGEMYRQKRGGKPKIRGRN